jgi:hypothetical protein
MQSWGNVIHLFFETGAVTKATSITGDGDSKESSSEMPEIPTHWRDYYAVGGGGWCFFVFLVLAQDPMNWKRNERRRNGKDKDV